MKIFTKLVSVFLLVAIGSLFFFSCAEKEKCTPMVSFLVFTTDCYSISCM